MLYNVGEGVSKIRELTGIDVGDTVTTLLQGKYPAFGNSGGRGTSGGQGTTAGIQAVQEHK